MTESGQLLYQYAEQLLSQMEEVKRRIYELEAGTAGTLRIGVSSACSNMLVDYIAAFRAQFSQIKINIFSGDSEEVLTKLKLENLADRQSFGRLALVALMQIRKFYTFLSAKKKLILL